jgi:molecular chaperone DnaK (HSP70)
MLSLLAQVLVTQVLLLDVTPLLLGIKTVRGVMTPLPLGRCHRKE